MSWYVVGSAGGAIIGGLFSNKAAKSQADSAQRAVDAQLQMYNQTRKDQAPWLQAGGAGVNSLSNYLGLPSTDQPDANTGSLLKNFSMADYQADPGYQFRLQQGMLGLDRSSSARGLNQSGGALKDLVAYNSGEASNEYSNAYNRYNQNQSNIYNRLAGISGLGQTSAAQVGNNAIQSGNNIGNSLMNKGNAIASGYAGGANAINSGISNYLNYQQSQNYLNQMQNNNNNNNNSFPQGTQT